MLNQIINDFIFSKLLFIVIIALIGFAVINYLKKKDEIDIKESLNVKKINVTLLLKYLFLSFIVRITLEQLVIFIHIPSTDIQVPANIFEIIVEFITSCIFAPVFEEIIFRFGIFQKISRKLNVYISILLTSVFFPLLHLYNIDSFVILLGISLIWHYSFYKTNNLIYPIILHFFHNLYAISDNLLNYSNYWYILLAVSIIGYIITIVRKQNN